MSTKHRVRTPKVTNLEPLAHEIWATAQLQPTEGIEDGVARILKLLMRFGASSTEHQDWERIAFDHEPAFLEMFCPSGERLITVGWSTDKMLAHYGGDDWEATATVSLSDWLAFFTRKLALEAARNPVKPLFIPLYTQWFREFQLGKKTVEHRTYGPRWNEKTCFVGRKVVLSKGYGKQERLNATIIGFRRSGKQAYIHLSLS